MDILSTEDNVYNNTCYYNYTKIYHQCKIVKFNKSPPMSTYLVAFVVGIYDSITNTTSNNLPISIYFPLGESNRATYGLKVAQFILPKYEELFQIGFPLPKMDVIALNDFSAGAMENWVFIVYYPI